MDNTELQHLSLGTSDFSALRQWGPNGQIYVDKTAQIYEIASRQEKFFLARPRRFGKSLLVSTFESLFKYGLRDFNGLAIERLWKEEKTYQVIRLDFSRVKPRGDSKEFFFYFEEYLSFCFEDIGFKRDVYGSVVNQIEKFLKKMQNSSLVLLIDEYDAPLTACLNDPHLFEKVRGILSTFYSMLKINDRVIKFLFMTGITKFDKTGIFSELNNLSDLTLDTSYGALLGFTRDEVERYFGDYLTRASEVLNIEKSQLVEELTAKYGGFCFEKTTKQHVLAPWSVLKFLASPSEGFLDYWFESGGSPTSLIPYLKPNSQLNPDAFGKEKSISLRNLSALSDTDKFSDIGLLTQTGYLTLKKINGTTAYVDYPNAEVRISMAQLYLGQLLNRKTAVQVGAGSIAHALGSENAETVYDKLNILFKGINQENYPATNEATVRAYVQVYMSAAGLEARTEVQGNPDSSDLEVTSGNRLWIFEFKVVNKEQNPETKLQEAINQIVKRDFGNPTGFQELRRVALVFSPKQWQFVKWAEV